MHETRLLRANRAWIAPLGIELQGQLQIGTEAKIGLRLCERWTRARVGRQKLNNCVRLGGCWVGLKTELGKRAGLSLPTVKRVETGKGARVSEKARAKLQSALEAAGVIFIEENGGGPGLVKKRRKNKIGQKIENGSIKFDKIERCALSTAPISRIL